MYVSASIHLFWSSAVTLKTNTKETYVALLEKMYLEICDRIHMRNYPSKTVFGEIEAVKNDLRSDQTSFADYVLNVDFFIVHNQSTISWFREKMPLHKARSLEPLLEKLPLGLLDIHCLVSVENIRTYRFININKSPEGDQLTLNEVMWYRLCSPFSLILREPPQLEKITEKNIKPDTVFKSLTHEPSFEPLNCKPSSSFNLNLFPLERNPNMDLTSLKSPTPPKAKDFTLCPLFNEERPYLRKKKIKQHKNPPRTCHSIV